MPHVTPLRYLATWFGGIAFGLLVGRAHVVVILIPTLLCCAALISALIKYRYGERRHE